MASVYGLYSSSDKERIRYIGITKNDDPAARLAQHHSAARYPRGKNSNWPVYLWMRKHIENGHVIESLLFATGITWSEACAMEVKLIAKYRTLYGDLMNLTDGGDGRMGYSHSEDTKRKMSLAAKKRLESPEAREKIAIAMRNRTISPETRQKIGDANRRRPRRTLTEEHKKKIGDAHRGRKNLHHVGRPHTEETKKKLSEINKGKKRGPLSEETRKKISDARKAHNARQSQKSD